MAVFGFHLVLTMITATVFNKLAMWAGICDFFIFKGLSYYLMEGSLISKPGGNFYIKRRRKKKETVKPEETVDRLIKFPLTSNALEGVPFFDSHNLVINYTLFAVLVYTTSELFNFVFPETKALNTSLVWMTCALFMQIHILAKISLQKVAAHELYAERNTLICVSALFFLASVTLCAFCDKFIDVDFVDGYRKFVDAQNEYVVSQGFSPIFGERARSPMMFLLSLSLLYSFTASSFFFPTLQYSSLYLDALEKRSPASRAALHFGLIAPFGIIMLYTRPVVEHFVESYSLSYEQLKALRVCSIVFWALVRIATAKPILQTFLDQPKNKIEEFRKEQLKDEECQKKIAYFASYVCTTSLQYHLPVFIALSATLLSKNFCSIRISTLWGDQAPLINELEHHAVLRIFFSTEVQEPFWTLTVVVLLTFQFLISVIGIVGRR